MNQSRSAWFIRNVCNAQAPCKIDFDASKVRWLLRACKCASVPYDIARLILAFAYPGEPFVAMTGDAHVRVRVRDAPLARAATPPLPSIALCRSAACFSEWLQTPFMYTCEVMETHGYKRHTCTITLDLQAGEGARAFSQKLQECDRIVESAARQCDAAGSIRPYRPCVDTSKNTFEFTLARGKSESYRPAIVVNGRPVLLRHPPPAQYLFDSLYDCNWISLVLRPAALAATVDRFWKPCYALQWDLARLDIRGNDSAT